MLQCDSPASSYENIHLIDMVMKSDSFAERTGPTSNTRLIEAKVIKGCRIDPEDACEENEMRIPLETKYEPTYEAESPEQFWENFTQCIWCTHKPPSERCTLHRDISINNLGSYIKGNEEELGVLMDFDLSSIGSQEHRSRFRSGTTPFMAREALDVRKTYTHKFHHELESLLYVLVWHTLGYRTSRGKYPSEVLDGWRKGSWNTILNAKRPFITDQWKDIFPITDSSEGFLHKRCRLICMEYGDLAANLGKAAVAAMRARKPFQANGYVVKYPRWLRSVGFDTEACNGDCCVYSH